MKKTFFLLFILLAAAGGAFAFLSTITYPPIAHNNNGMSLVTESPGVFALTGDYDDPTYSWSGFIARLDSSGNSITINTTPSYDFYDGIKTPGGYAVLASFYDIPPYSSSKIVSLDATGNCISVKAINDESFHTGSLCNTTDNGIVAGVDEYGSGGDQLFLERYDSSGNCVWAMSYDYYSYLYKITGSSDGGFFVGGEGPLYGAFVMKVDGSGNKLWAWEDTSSGRIYNMIPAENGSVIAVGYSDGTGTTHPLAVKLDGSGNKVWENIMDWGSNTGYARQILPASNTRIGYVMSGIFADASGTGYSSFFALQIDGNGNTGNFKSVLTNYSVYNGFSALISADHLMIAGVDDSNRIITTDYSAAVYQSVPAPGGTGSDKSYACPQPAKDFVRFVYALQDRATVKINIYNFANRLVGQNVSDELPADNVTTQVDTTKLSSGVYFYQIIAQPAGKAEKRLKTGEFIIKK